MRARSLACWLLLGLLSCAKPAESEPSTRLYVNSFGSGSIAVVGLETGDLEGTIPVEDSTGSIGAQLSASGERLFVIDGDRSHRLRVFDTRSLQPLAEHGFTHRVLLRGGGPVSHLTADARFLFVDTYDYGAAASGVRTFDVGKDAFQSVGLRGRACAAPKLASTPNGMLIQICPASLVEFRPIAAAPTADFIAKRRAETSLDRVADFALSPDASRLYLLGYVEDGGPWRFVIWNLEDGKVHERDLRSSLEVPADAPGRGGQAWLDVGASGRLGIVHGPRSWFLDGESLEVQGRVDLPSPADGAAFSLDGKELLSFRGYGGGQEIGTPTLYRVPVDGSAVRSLPLPALKGFGTPTVLIVGASP